MKFTFNRTIIVTFLFWAVCTLGGCGCVQESVSGSHSGQVATDEPTPEPTPDAGKIIVEDGCNIPRSPRLQIYRSFKTTWNSETGKKVNVHITDYSSQADFFYAQDPLTPMQKNISFGGTLKLMWMREFRSGQKVFSYTMYSRKKKIDTDESQNANGWNDQMVPYTCVDADGDGRFETVLTTADLLVPIWAFK